MSLGFVLFTRNHAAIAANRLLQWREILPSLTTRWLVVDLGSTDATVRSLQSQRVDVTVLAGGHAEMMRTAWRSAAAIGTELVVFADAAAEPSAGLKTLISAAREGAPLAVSNVRRPGVVVIATRRFSEADTALYDLWQWAADVGEPAECDGDVGGLTDDDVGSVAQLIDRRKRRWLKELGWRVRGSLPRG